jgi:hypothetical protein
MRHWIGMILAAMMTGVLFFPGVWGYLRLLRFPAPAGQLSQRRAPAAVEDRGWRSATLTDWPMTVRGSSCAGFGERNGCPASGVLPVWPMFCNTGGAA